MAKKKSLAERETNRLRIQQIVFSAIAIIMILAMVIGSLVK